MNIRLVALGVLVLTGLLYGAYRSWWSGPVAEARADLAAYRERLQKAGQEVRRGRQASKALDDLRARTLGGDEETVDHRVRTQLNRLLESFKVAEATVITSEPRLVETPARSVMGRAQASLRKRRDEPDFATLEFKIGGVAPVGRVLGLLTELRAQSWPCRIEDVRLDPVFGGAGLRFSVRCTTMFLWAPTRVSQSLQTHPPKPWPNLPTLSAAIRSRFPRLRPSPRHSPTQSRLRLRRLHFPTTDGD